MEFSVKKVSLKKVVVLLTAIATVNVASADILQGPQIDPGAATQDLRRREQRLQQKDAEEERPAIQETEAAEVSDEEGATFELLSIKFTRSKYLSEDHLRDIVSPYLKQQIDFSVLEKIVAQINQKYRELNVFTAMAVLPPQKIENGIVRIRLVEGKLGQLLFEGNEYTQGEYLKTWIDHEEQAETIDISKLEQDITRYNRVQNQRLQAELRAGEKFGLTDIVVLVEEQKQDQLQVFTDNYGYESSGEEELGVLYQRMQWLLPGDRSLAYVQGSEGAQSVNLSYNAPIAATGWRVGGSFSHTETEVVAGDFAIVDVEGESNRIAIEASHLTYSKDRFYVTTIGSISHTTSETDISSVPLSDYTITQYQLGAELNWYDEQWQLTGRQLISMAQTEDQLVDNDQDVNSYNTSLTAVYNFELPYYLVSYVEYQHTNEDGLVGGLSYSLGGPTTVRGYESGVVSGDRGWHQQIEGHYNGWNSLDYFSALEGYEFDTYIFYDHGKVESLNPEQKLASFGLGLAVANKSGLRFDLTVGNATKNLTPNQDDTVAYARLTYDCL